LILALIQSQEGTEIGRATSPHHGVVMRPVERVLYVRVGRSQAQPDVESPLWPPLSALAPLDKDRPLGPLDHLVTVVMLKAPRGRYIGGRVIFIHN